jgi:hypothetical protein
MDSASPRRSGIGSPTVPARGGIGFDPSAAPTGTLAETPVRSLHSSRSLADVDDGDADGVP